MCCGVPKYNPNRVNQVSNPALSPAEKKALVARAVPVQRPAMGRKITVPRGPMVPQKLLPKHAVPAKQFK